MNRTTNWRCFGAKAAWALSLIAAPALAGESTPNLLWSHTLSGETYTDYSVTIGNHGTEILSDTGLFTRYTRLYSTGGASGPAWQASSSNDGYEHRVDSSHVSNFHVACRQEPNASLSRDVVVEGYRSSSPSTAWSYQFPETVNGGNVNFVQVTADGSWVYAAVKGSSGVHIVKLDPNTSTQAATPAQDFVLPFTGGLSAFKLSDDGTRAYLASALYSKVYNTSNQALMYDSLVFGGGNVGHSFSGDGRTIAHAKNSGYQVHREASGTFSLLQTFEPFGSDSSYNVGPSALSKDGKLFVGTFFKSPEIRTAHVFAWNTETGQQLLSDTRVSTSSSYQHKVSSIAMSESGTNRFAVGFWGDGGTSNVPEIVSYDRPNAFSNFSVHATFDRPGSVRELDISTDGTRLASSGGDTHLNAGTASKVVEAFDLGSELFIRGAPQIGRTVHIDYFTSPNSVAVILDSPLLAPTPVSMGIGTLHLNRPTTVRLLAGGTGADGKATLHYQLNSNFLGETRYFQGLTIPPTGPASLSESWTTLTVLP